MSRRPGPGRRARRWIAGASSILLLVLVWWAAAQQISASIILPTPWETLVAGVSLVGAPQFLSAVGATLIRGLGGFGISLVPALGLGLWAGLSDGCSRFLRPYIVVTRSTPVIAIILIAIIWFNSAVAPVFVSFLMVFPIMFTNIEEGVRSVDRELVEMTTVYRVAAPRVLRHVYLPSIVPFMLSGIQTALGLTWKVVVATEVLSEPLFGVGTELNTARIFLDMPRVFAWTAVAVLLSAGSDLILSLVRRWVSR